MPSGPNGKDDVQSADDDDGDVDGGIGVEVSIAEDEVKVEFVGHHHPTAAEGGQVVAAALCHGRGGCGQDLEQSRWTLLKI